MILANGCNITKSEKFKGVWILSVPTISDKHTCIIISVRLWGKSYYLTIQMCIVFGALLDQCL